MVHTGVGVGCGARHLQVRGRFTSGGQAGTDRAEGRRRGDIKGEDKGRRGREIRAPAAAGRHEEQINDEDGGNELSRYSRVLNTIVHKSDNVAIQRRPCLGRLRS